MDKTPAAWGPRASKNVRGTVNCNREESTTPSTITPRSLCGLSARSTWGVKGVVRTGVGGTSATP